MRHLDKAIVAAAAVVLTILLFQKSSRLETGEDLHDVKEQALVEAAETSSDAPAGAVAARTDPDPARSTEAWARAIDDVLRDQGEIAARAQRMLQLLPQLPPAMQTEAAQHLVNFASDDAPQTIVEPLLEARADPSAQAVLLLGLLQRGDQIRLPTLLRIAKNPEHPKHAEALQYLEFLLEASHGMDWMKWEESVRERLSRTTI